MFVSILIPVFNYDISILLSSLLEQIKDTHFSYEIQFYDDASTDKIIQEKNSLLCKDKSAVLYHILSQNVGRSKIRNLLAQSANGEYLLFLDADTTLRSPYFLSLYAQYAQREKVVCGGFEYPTTRPSPSSVLRWHYGHQREAISATHRSLKPHAAFISANFFLHKSLFEKVGGFDETISTYGHEDTLFGWELKTKNIDILHIENPALHLNEETNEVFLQKTETGLKNLSYMYKKFPAISQDIKLLKAFMVLKKMYLIYFAKIIFWLFAGILKKYLQHSKKPHLSVFDTYKLLYLAHIW